MNVRKLLLLGLVTVLVLVAVAFWFRSSRGDVAAAGKAKGPGRGSGEAGGTLPVYTHVVEPRLLEERISATGTVAAEEAVELVSELSGKVAEVLFDEGSRVRQGQVLVRLDDSELRAEVARAESQLSLAETQAQRQAALVEGGGTTRESLDVARNEVKVLEAELALVRAQLAKTEVRAPFDGLIGLRHVSPGAYLTPSARIASLQNLDRIKVEFTIAERHLNRIDQDAAVTISVAGVTEPFPGRVYAIEPRIDAATRTLRLRARAENPGGRALPGGFATVEMTLQQVPDALLVPANALIAGLNEQQVFVIEGGRAQPRTVQTGLRLAREVQIVDGLEPGAEVITSGQMQLRPGMPVRAVPPPEDATRKVLPGASSPEAKAPPRTVGLHGGGAR